MIVCWLLRLLGLLVAVIPRWVTYGVAERIADLAYLTLRGKRAALQANLARVLQSEEPRQLDPVLRRAFQNFGKYLVDFLIFPQLSRVELLRRVHFDGWPTLDRAIAEGRGLIFITAHIGNWDVGAAALAAAGYPVNVVVERLAYSPLDRLVRNTRAGLGVKLLAVERIGPSLLRSLQRGEILALLIDRPLTDGGVIVSFFGEAVRVTSGPARIALRTGARIMPGAVIRRSGRDDGFDAVVDTDFQYQATGDEERDVIALTQAMMHALERLIICYPDQWFMFRHLWPRPYRLPRREQLLAPEA